MPMGSDPDEGISAQSDDWRGKTHYTHNLIKTKFASISEEVQDLRAMIKQNFDSLKNNNNKTAAEEP